MIRNVRLDADWLDANYSVWLDANYSVVLFSGRSSGLSLGSRFLMWLDDVSPDTLRTIDTYLTEQYHLRQEAAGGKHLTKRGLSLTEYADFSLVHLRSPGNLFVEYEKVLEEQWKEGRDRLQDLFDHTTEKDPARYERSVRDRFQQTANATGRDTYLKLLEGVLGRASSTVVSVANQVRHLHYRAYHSDAPENDPEAPLHPAVVKVDMVPLKKDVLQGLVGLLTAHNLSFERDAERKVVRDILAGKVKEYEGDRVTYHRVKRAS